MIDGAHGPRLPIHPAGSRDLSDTERRLLEGAELRRPASASGESLTSTPAVVRASDPQLKDKVGRLVQFLKDLVTAKAVPVRQVSAHLDHLWLEDLRDLAALDLDAATGDVVVRVPRVVPDPAPALPDSLHGLVSVVDRDNSTLERPPLRDVEIDDDVRGAYDSWLEEWQAWAAQDRPRRRLQRTYEQLRSMRLKSTENPESVEIVLAGGLLTLPDSAIRTHLLSHRVVVDVEVETGDVVVSLDPSGTTSLEDGRVLAGLAEFDDGGTSFLRGRITELDVRPSGAESVVFLKEWADRALLAQVQVVEDWSAPPTGRATLAPAPAIVLRSRGAYALQEYYGDIERTLSDEGSLVPLGLAQLVESIEKDERLAWLEATGSTAAAEVTADPLFPLPANEEQAQIIGRLRDDTGVVVEGPPGTGKTHTIANLVSALLARGQRVLVTSEKAQALSVLREKLPEEMQELCVSLTDVQRGGSLELARSVGRLASEHSSYNPQRTEREVHDLQGKLDQARRHRSSLLESIRRLRESETAQHPEIAPGFGGTLARMAEKVADGTAAFAWMPVPAVGGFPLAVPELMELRQALPADTEARRERRGQSFPSNDVVPSPDVVDRLAQAVARGVEARAREEGPLADALGTLDAGTLAELTRRCRDLAEQLAQIRESTDADWALPLLDVVLRGDDPVLWQHIGGARAVRDQVVALNQQIGFADVRWSGQMPPGAGADRFGRFARYLGAGGSLKKVFKSDEQKAVEPVLDAVTVDGQPVVTAGQAHLVSLHLHCLARLQTFAQTMELVRVPVDLSIPRPQQVSRASRVWELVEAIDRVRAARDELVTQIRRVPTIPRVDLRTTEALTRFVSIATVFADVETARRSSDELRRLADLVSAAVPWDQQPPELRFVIDALVAADAVGYRDGLADLTSARREKEQQVRCDELVTRLSAVSPRLVETLRETATEPMWDTRIEQVEAAWAWARAATYVRQESAPGREAELDRELGAVEKDTASLTAQLAAAQAWQSCLTRMTASQVTALQAYRDSMANVGKGSGKYAQRYRQAAREAMTAAQSAVPAWVMPLQEVLASIPPQQGAFDVVIVDEASQVGIENLFLLWLAPRVIVVGDDKQCTPSEVKHGALDKVFSRLDVLLPDVPNYLRSTLTPRSSVFSTLRTRFGQVVRLREHFRCMPEIIMWSSQMFYRDAPLIPVRQHGADRLTPLRTSFVPGAYIEGANALLRNVVEAEAVVDALVDCLDDSRYDGKTFGVVVLQGQAQVKIINEALMKRVDQEEWERRRIRVGTAPDFQGDERDVVLLSMVTAPDHKRASQTRMDAQRSYNVAASRARDQLWLFHSVTTDQLRPDDLRSQLLTYLSAAPVAAAAAMPQGVTDDERCDPFDSLFEQRVFRRIQQRGYHVTPQVEVNGRRIDLVVTGSQGKLAVECDGDAWHSSPEQLANDLARELELKRCGWAFWRIRESRYYLDPDEALTDLWHTLDKRGIGPVVIEGAGRGGDWVPGELSEEDGPDALEQEDGHSSTESVAAVPEQLRPTQRAETTAENTAGQQLEVPFAQPARPAAARPVLPPVPPPMSRSTPGLRPPGPRTTTAFSASSPADALLLDLAKDGALTNEVVRRFLGLSPEGARKALMGLVERGLLEQRGAKRGTHYVLPGAASAAPADAQQPEMSAAEGPELEARLERRLRDDAGAVTKKSGYRPSYYLHMINQEGALGAAKRLLADPRPQHGIEVLWEHGLLGHSLEAAVCAPEFRDLFTGNELQRARKRLKDMGYTSGS